jgi:antitoxin ParD1/3/4
MVREKVESGRYSDSGEVIREALQLLEQRDNVERLRTAIAVGKEQIERGEGIEFTPELLAEIGREVDERFRRGDVPGADVCP